jgi:hypothetical protein
VEKYVYDFRVGAQINPIKVGQQAGRRPRRLGIFKGKMKPPTDLLEPTSEAELEDRYEPRHETAAVIW